MRNFLDKLLEYRELVLRLEGLRQKHGGKLEIDISPKVKVTERWKKNGSEQFFEKEFRIANIDAEIVRLKDNIKYHESKSSE